ncbi:MAG: hypothetical protein WC497_01865 [Patescibacteria group bacterium]
MPDSKNVEILKNGIRKYAPVVAEYFDCNDTITEFSHTLYAYTADSVHTQRQELLARTIAGYLARVFQRQERLTPPLSLNIVDHHSILNHPILLATNLVANAHRLLTGDRQPIVVLTSSVVPPNNFFNRKGFQLHGKRVPLFSNKEMHQASCFIGRRDFNFTENLRKTDSWNNFTGEEQDFLKAIEQEIGGLDFSRVQSYNDQIGVINAFLWKKLFHKSIRETIPDLLYVTQEDIMRTILPSVLAEDNILSRSLFKSDFRTRILAAFEDLTGCWNEAKGKGTHFFWYRDAKNEAKPMFLRGTILRSTDGRFELDLGNSAEVIKSLADGAIIPNLFVIFGYLTFWLGVRPLVGHGSCNYLTKMKEAWLSVLADEPDESARVQSVDTKGLIGGTIATYARDAQNAIINQYAFDVIYDGGLTRDYLEHLLAMKYKDLLQPALLEIYESYVPAAERKNLGLRPMDMMGEEFNWIGTHGK